MGQRVHIQRVTIDHFQLAGIGGGDFRQCGHTPAVLFNRQNPPRAFGQQPTGQPAGAGADFQHIALRQIPRQPCDFGGQVQIQQEILPQRFFRRDPVIVDDLPQGGKGINAAHAVAFLASAIWRASFSASIRELASAMPCPAISNAVP